VRRLSKIAHCQSLFPVTLFLVSLRLFLPHTHPDSLSRSRRTETFFLLFFRTRSLCPFRDYYLALSTCDYCAAFAGPPFCFGNSAPANTVPCCAVIAPLPPSTRVGGNPFSSFAPRVAAFPIDCQSAIVRCAATVHTHTLSRTHSRRHAHARTHTHPSSRQRTQLSSITRVCLDNFPFATSPLLGLVSICLVCPLRSNQA